MKQHPYFTYPTPENMAQKKAFGLLRIKNEMRLFKVSFDEKKVKGALELAMDHGFSEVFWHVGERYSSLAVQVPKGMKNVPETLLEAFKAAGFQRVTNHRWGLPVVQRVV